MGAAETLLRGASHGLPITALIGESWNTGARCARVPRPQVRRSASYAKPNQSTSHLVFDGPVIIAWADASSVPVIINGLASGRVKIRIELVNANHQPIDQGTILVT